MAESTGTAPKKKAESKSVGATIPLPPGKPDRENFDKIEAHLKPQFEALGATLNARTVLSNALKFAVKHIEGGAK